jgi:hypothetical protein
LSLSKVLCVVPLIAGLAQIGPAPALVWVKVARFFARDRFLLFSDRSVNRRSARIPSSRPFLRQQDALACHSGGKTRGSSRYVSTYFFQEQVADNVTRGDTHNWPKKNNYYLYTECHNRVSKQLTLESLVDGFFPLFA